MAGMFDDMKAKAKEFGIGVKDAVVQTGKEVGAFAKDAAADLGSAIKNPGGALNNIPKVNDGLKKIEDGVLKKKNDLGGTRAQGKKILENLEP